ncbi:hypothetical protein ACFY2H_39960 [Streptomyces griseofuscus]|uniref:hypothetical protein n=1 Tax=Streptomyces griseofuscus TaxID=146922 RepID=UPI003686E216
MRDSIARTLLWVLRLLLPAHGKRRAIPAASPAIVPAPAPRSESTAAWSRPWHGPSADEARAIFHAEETRSLTPEQRERWWAVAFAEIGVDYDFPTINITGIQSFPRGVAA